MRKVRHGSFMFPSQQCHLEEQTDVRACPAKAGREEWSQERELVWSSYRAFSDEKFLFLDCIKGEFGLWRT